MWHEASGRTRNGDQGRHAGYGSSFLVYDAVMVTGPLGVELEQLKRPNTAIAFSGSGVPGTRDAKAFLQEAGIRASVVAAPLARDAREHTKGRVISERSGGPQDDDVVLVLGPTIKLMSKILKNRNATLVIGEWPSTPLRWVGRLVGALDIARNKRLSVELDDAVLEALRAIDWAGNNGWSDKLGKRDAERQISTLRADSVFDPELVSAYMMATGHSPESIERLHKIMNYQL